MTAQAAPEELTLLLGWLCLTGLGVLIGVAVHEVRRKPAAPPPAPFGPCEPGLLIAVSLLLFVGLGVSQWLVLKRFAHALEAGLAVAAVLAVGAYVRFLRPVYHPRETWGRRTMQGIVVTWMALPVIYGVALIVVNVAGTAPPQPTVVKIARRDEGWIGLAVMAVVLAPVMEEMVFRGTLYPALRRMWGKWAALVFTAGLFGFIHPPTVWAPMAVYGLFLAYLVERTGSVWPCIVSHAAFNGLTVGQLLFSG